MSVFQSINPYDQSIVGTYPLFDNAHIEKKISNAENAFRTWQTVPLTQKGEFLSKIANLFRQQHQQLATLITSEMGKPISEAFAEIEKCALTCEFFAQHSEAFLRDDTIHTEAKETFITFQPLGTILGIMPWNFPFWQVIRFAAPTLMAGNTVLIKHAPNVVGCALALERVFLEAGLPEGVFSNLIVDIEPIGKILHDGRIKGVSLTGSERAGRAVASLAGNHLKKSVLELGGSDAFIVLKDADLELATEIGLRSRLSNAGQVCISAKRFIVQKEVKDAFVAKLLKDLINWQPENPLLTNTKMGPLARIDIADAIERQYFATIRQGANSITQFRRDNCIVHPMLLENVPAHSVAFQEETFGPLIAITTASTEEEAIALANNSSFGLGASVFTPDIEKGLALAKQIAAGAVFINEQVRSDPRFPIGGINHSGYGRELGSLGIKEFTNAKTVYVA